MFSQRLKKHANELVYLQKARPCIRNHLITKADRVKVMDTLDKKIQTILEREDLSADERLKLYDQSLYRYLNVYDDYTPVAVAPEPVKQDLVDDEILDSIPKTMKAKAQELQKFSKTDDVYKIETILKKRIKGRKVQYLVMWLGYPESFNSWIFKQDLQKRGVTV
jgi:CRISPR/Cas system CMR-associated protein Cmr3 (group 5 of RAMP superfamily)